MEIVYLIDSLAYNRLYPHVEYIVVYVNTKDYDDIKKLTNTIWDRIDAYSEDLKYLPKFKSIEELEEKASKSTDYSEGVMLYETYLKKRKEKLEEIIKKENSLNKLILERYEYIKDKIVVFDDLTPCDI